MLTQQFNVHHKAGVYRRQAQLGCRDARVVKLGAVGRIGRPVADRSDVTVRRQDSHREVCSAERKDYPNDVALQYGDLVGCGDPLAYGKARGRGKRLVERRALHPVIGGPVEPP